MATMPPFGGLNGDGLQASAGGAGSYEVTVTPLAGGDGAVVTHRPAPDPHGARSVR
jgi:hypothetical protein